MDRPDLSEQVAALTERWELQIERRFPATPGSPGNFVATALRADGTRCVLKVSQYLTETRSEIAALAMWRGHGAARLLASAADVGGLLMEQVEPGTMLAAEEPYADEATTRVAADLLRELWIRPDTGVDLISLDTWFAAYDRNRDALVRSVAGFPAVLFQRADALRAELLSSTDHPVVLHGDLHHYNILRSERAGWLAIDPKGLVGDPCFDVCQFLLNPDRHVPLGENRRRLEIFCSELDLDPLRTRQWCLVHAVLDACWSFEDGVDYRSRVAYAEQTLQF